MAYSLPRSYVSPVQYPDGPFPLPYQTQYYYPFYTPHHDTFTPDQGSARKRVQTICDRVKRLFAAYVQPLPLPAAPGVTFVTPVIFPQTLSDPTLHPSLRVGTFEPMVWWFDVQASPFRHPFPEYYQINSTGHHVLAAPATSPPQRSLKIICREFPWVTLKVRTKTHVTVRDVLREIYHFMWEIVPRESGIFEAESEPRRHKVTTSYSRRVNGISDWYQSVVYGWRDNEPLRRLDWAGKRTKFVGLKEGVDGIWVMELEKFKYN